MRTAFFIFLLANLLFLAWAHWIAASAQRSDRLTGVPRLQLVYKNPPVIAAAARPAASGALGAALAARSSPLQADAAHAVSGSPQASVAQCVSIGPFERDSEALRISAVLRGRKLAPKVRTTLAHPVTWYWVHIPNLSGGAGVQRVLARLKRDGIRGAEPLPARGGKPGISLGLFQDRNFAQREQARARAGGVPAQLTERLVATPQYWLDLWVPGGAAALPMHALSPKIGVAVAAQPCPPGEAPPGNGAAPISQGIPAPSDRANPTPALP